MQEYPYKEILFRNKKRQVTDTCHNMYEPPKTILLSGKWPDAKDYILHHSTDMECPEKATL